MDRLSVAFPIWCELLTGMPLNEIQKTLYRSVKEYPDSLQLVENFTDMIGDETIATDPEELVGFLTEKGHPALSMEPMM